MHLLPPASRIRLRIASVSEGAAADLRHEKLACECGLNHTYISMVERGKKVPTLGAVFRICKATGVKPTTLMERIEGRGWTGK